MLKKVGFHGPRHGQPLPMMLLRNDIAPPRPEIMSNGAWALFLDLDGTLLDIAASPESVFVPKNLIETLAKLRMQLDGAVAVLSGRGLRTIDRLLHPLLVCAGAEHGAVLRFPDGTIMEAAMETVVPTCWRQQLHRQAEEWPGVLIEEKTHGVAVHYRANPQLGLPVIGLLEKFVESNSAFEILPALMARELRHRTINKGEALRRLMQTEIFDGRKPLFIGDDVTDEDAIAAAHALGGLGFRVQEAFAGEPARVRAWLAEIAAHVNAPVDTAER